MLTLPCLFLVAILGLAPPDSVRACDTPNDQGQSISLTWAAPAGESLSFTGYLILRSTGPDSGFAVIGNEPAARTEYMDNDVQDGARYYYRVAAYSEADTARSVIAGPAVSSAQWFNTSRLNILVMTIVICAIFMYYTQRARAGAKMFIRKIAGLDAIDDALGRATEMGKPILLASASAKSQTLLLSPPCRSCARLPRSRPSTRPGCSCPAPTRLSCPPRRKR
ncbi:MAG TPA: fibronectin type III domain-containing protein [bacterium]|nr:fibronectin type III domain-containing protein [bacterium]